MTNERTHVDRRTVDIEQQTTNMHAKDSGSGTALRESPTPAGQANLTSFRRRSPRKLWGMPLWEIASGPDEHGRPGHARAVFAVGDKADGIVAIGGIARGIVSIGGVSFGLVSLGGVAISLLAAMGGVAIAGLAFGGVAVGGVAIGGAAVGVYAKGDAATGLHATDRKDQDPAAVQFFDSWLPSR
jgi:hypothetical protein